MQTNYQNWSEQAEQSILGCILIDNYQLPEITEVITSTDFWHLSHALIFQAIESLHADNKPVDVTTLISHLGDKLNEAGGIGYLAELAQNTPSARNALSYAQIIKDKRKERDVLCMASEMVSIIQADDHSSQENVNNALSIISTIDTDDPKEITFGQQNKDFLKNIEARSLSEGLTGYSTGFTAIDTRLNGFQKSDLMILAGRPGSGKSTMAFNMAKHVAKSEHVVIFSMEMSSDQILEKTYSSYGIPLSRIRSGNQMIQEDWTNLGFAAEKTAKLSLTIDDRGALKPQQIRAKCLKLNRKHGHLGLVVVDYMQLMTTNSSHNRVDSVTQISGALKALAKELDCPVLALSQLSRKTEERSNKRPILSDLRDSGSLEQDADIIMFIYRDDYYAEQEGRDSVAPNIAEINTAKFRCGEVGRDILKTELHYSRFIDTNETYTPKEPESKSFKYDK